MLSGLKRLLLWNILPTSAAPSKRYLSPYDLFAVVGDNKLSSEEKISNIKNMLEQATDEVKLDASSKQYVICSEQFHGETIGDIAVNIRGLHGYTLLGHCIKFDEFEVAKWLIAQGADVNAGTLSPLMIVAEKGNIPMMEYLHAKGANIDAQTAQYFGDPTKGHTSAGTTALHRAVRFGKKDAVDFLIQRDASLLQTSRKETPIDLCKNIIEGIKIIQSGKEDSNTEFTHRLFGYSKYRAMPSLEVMNEILETLTLHYENREEKTFSPGIKRY